MFDGFHTSIVDITLYASEGNKNGLQEGFGDDCGEKINGTEFINENNKGNYQRTT